MKLGLTFDAVQASLSIIDHGLMKLTLGVAGMFLPVTMRVFMVIAGAVRLK
jgi:uncharacterized membrane protein YbaN (DUF454 family)